jgi:5'-nucleotidase
MTCLFSVLYKELLSVFMSNYNYLSIPGLRVEYDVNKPNGNRVVKALARCGECRVPKYEPVEPNKSYNVIMPAFIANGGDGYTVLKKNNKEGEEMGTFIS